MKRFDQKGSHVIGLLLFAVFVAVAGFTGYKVWQMHSNAPVVASNPASTAAMVPTTIQNTAQLTQAASALDAASSQLNSGMNSSVLNTDMQSML